MNVTQNSITFTHVRFTLFYCNEVVVEIICKHFAGSKTTGAVYTYVMVSLRATMPKYGQNAGKCHVIDCYTITCTCTCRSTVIILVSCMYSFVCLGKDH